VYEFLNGCNINSPTLPFEKYLNLTMKFHPPEQIFEIDRENPVLENNPFQNPGYSLI
jgi:hypothetical protein